MHKVELKQFIQASIPVSEQIVLQIVEQFDAYTILKNEFFLREGKLSNEYLFLATGFMRSFTLDTEGNEVTTYFYSANGVVFEVSSFFLRSISTENIQALSDCTGYTITYEKLNFLFHSIPEFREFGRKILVQEFAAFKQRTLSLIHKSAEQRYAELLQNKQDVFQHAPLKYIASYLGITDTSLTRIRKEFAKK